MYLVFDCETTGLPVNWKASMTDLNNWPRVIQLAWAVYDHTDRKIAHKVYLIKPDGWTMPTGEFWQKHGYTQEKSEREGVPIMGALQEFLNDLNGATVMVSHNMSFDYNVVGAELIRHGLRAQAKPKKVCTKETSTQFCALPGTRGYKWPKLEELHHVLFREGFDGAHDAMNDVFACARCFFELKRLGVITIGS